MNHFKKTWCFLLILSIFLLSFLSKPSAYIYSNDSQCKIEIGSIDKSLPNTAVFASATELASTVDYCGFIKSNCDASYYSIATHYYCSSWFKSNLLPVAYCLVILLNISIICITLSILVSSYLYKSLSHLCMEFNIGDSILSFILVPISNASPDLFNFYSAFNSGSPDLVLGQLIGSLLILFTIIIGTISIANLPYQVLHPKLLLIDLVLVILVLVIFLYMISDGKFTLVECTTMTSLYGCYILFLSYYDKDKYIAEGLPATDHPYNVEDALSILSHHEARPKSPTPLSSDHADHLSVPLPLPNENHSFVSFNSAITDYGSISSTKSPVFDTLHNIEDFVIDESIHVMNIVVKTIDLSLFLLIPTNSNDANTDNTTDIGTLENSLTDFESDFLEDILNWNSIRKSPYLKYWYVIVTCLLINYELFQFGILDLLPIISLVIILTALIHGFLSKYIKEILIDVIGVLLSVIITSRVSLEILQLLKNFGLILRISEYMLGLIAFAISNSLNDFITNTTLSFINPAFGINACLGTPLITVLVGIGLNGVIVISKTHHAIKFTLSKSVIVTTASLILIMLILLFSLTVNKWKFDKTVGFIGISWYFIMVAINLYLGD